jgi:hypothetical protein
MSFHLATGRRRGIAGRSTTQIVSARWRRFRKFEQLGPARYGEAEAEGALIGVEMDWSARYSNEAAGQFRPEARPIAVQARYPNLTDIVFASDREGFYRGRCSGRFHFQARSLGRPT